MLTQIGRTVVASLLLLSLELQAVVQPFEAEYSVRYKGVPFASGHRLLVRQSDGSYRLNSDARVLGSGARYHNLSRFLMSSEQVYTLGFVHRQRGFLGRLDAKGEADQQGGLTVEVGREEHYFEAPKDVHQLLDAAGFSIQLQLDLKNGQRDLVYHYNVLDEVKEYRFEVIGREKIATGLGEFEALKVEQKKRGKPNTWLWMAPDLDYHLIRGEMIRNGKRRAVIETTRLDIQFENARVSERGSPSLQTVKLLD